MTAVPRGFAVLTVVLATVAVVLLAGIASASSVDLLLLVLVFTAAVMLEVAPVGINDDLIATMSVVVVFVAIAVGGVPAAATAGLAVGISSAFSIRAARVVKTAYNVAMHVVASCVAAVTFAVVADTNPLGPSMGEALQDVSRLTGGLLVAGLIYTVANVALVAAGVNRLSGVPWLPTCAQMVRQILPTQFLSVGLSAIAYVLLVESGIVAILLLGVPLLVARRSLRTVQEQSEAFDRMVRAFVKAIELKDGYTRGHAERVADLSVAVAERMGLSYEERQLIRYGAILHDVGKIGVSLGILCKAGPLDDDEFAEMKRHPEIGAEMLRDIDFLRPALSIVHHHHERMDGRGYPAGLSGDDIPLLTRVVTAVDAFDAMTSTRSYRRALPVEVALEELQANAGTQFDPTVVQHLVAVIAEEGWELTDEPVQVAHHDRVHIQVPQGVAR